MFIIILHNEASVIANCFHRTNPRLLLWSRKQTSCFKKLQNRIERVTGSSNGSILLQATKLYNNTAVMWLLIHITTIFIA